MEPSSIWEFRESPPSEVFRRRIREEREQRGWTQRDLADWMTAAGFPMTHDIVSRIESTTDPRKLSYDEAVAFSGVLEVPFVRLASPRWWDDEIAVRVDPRRPPLRPIELRNWFVVGHSWTPVARELQRGLKMARAASALLDPRLDEPHRANARDQILKLAAAPRPQP
jgi:transcriptional regulator with XRE-family HTH domain